jgi:hypothetical protein
MTDASWPRLVREGALRYAITRTCPRPNPFGVENKVASSWNLPFVRTVLAVGNNAKLEDITMKALSKTQIALLAKFDLIRVKDAPENVQRDLRRARKLRRKLRLAAKAARLAERAAAAPAPKVTKVPAGKRTMTRKAMGRAVRGEAAPVVEDIERTTAKPSARKPKASKRIRAAKPVADPVLASAPKAA